MKARNRNKRVQVIKKRERLIKEKQLTNGLFKIEEIRDNEKRTLVGNENNMNYQNNEIKI